jgi:hypothetical protein
MTNMKQIIILPVLVVMISLLAFSAQNVMAVTSTASDKLSCQSYKIAV